MMSKQSEWVKGAMSLMGAAFTYALFAIFIREMSVMYGDNMQVAVRFAIAFVAILLFVVLGKRFKPLPRGTLLKTLLLSLVFCLVVSSFTIAINAEKIANVIFVVFAGSILSSLIVGKFAFGEKLGTTKILAIILVLIGLAMYGDGLLALSLGLVAAFASGVLDGMANGLRKSLKGASRNTLLLYQYGLGTLVLLTFVLVTGEEPIRTVSTWPIILSFIYGLGMVLLGHLLIYGFQHFDVNAGTIIIAMELVFATILAALLYRELPTLQELLAGVFIFAGSALTVMSPHLAKLWQNRKSAKVLPE